MEHGGLLWYLIHPSRDHLLGFSDTTNLTSSEKGEGLRGHGKYRVSQRIAVSSRVLDRGSLLLPFLAEKANRWNYPANFIQDLFVSRVLWSLEQQCEKRYTYLV